MAIPRRPAVDEARLHDRRPETWLSPAEVATIRDAFSRPVSAESRAAVEHLSFLAAYQLALADDGQSFGAEEAARLADDAVHNAVEDRRRAAAEAWAKAAGLRWRDVHERFGFPW